MSVEMDIKITEKDMYRFNIHHAYTGFQGIFATVIGVLVLVVAGVTCGKVGSTYTVLYLLFGVLFLVYTPIALRTRAKRQMLLSPVLRETMHYVFDESGIHVSIGEQSADLEWSMVYRIISTKKQLLIYSTRVNAYILPLEQVGEHYDSMKALSQKQLEPYRCKLK